MTKLYIQDWINDQLAKQAEKLQHYAQYHPESFECGLAMGYKQSLLDLEHRLEEGYILKESKCWCGDKYHEPGFICL